MRCRSIRPAESAVTESGTSREGSLRWRAVTTTSSSGAAAAGMIDAAASKAAHERRAVNIMGDGLKR